MLWITLSLLTALATASQDAWVKRLSVLIGLGYGWLVFREKDIQVRLTGTMLMVAGAVLITLWGH